MNNLTIFVDESGTAVLNKPEHIKKHPFFIMGFVVCREPYWLREGMKRLLIKLHKRKKYPRDVMELKFNPYHIIKKRGFSKKEMKTKWEPCFDPLRRQTNSLIANVADGIFAGILDKRTIKKNTWTSETIGNFLFSRSLFMDVLPFAGNFNSLAVIHDRGRLNTKRTKDFNQYMKDAEYYLELTAGKQYAGIISEFKDANSLLDPGIWAADFVAGSFRHAYLHDDWTYVDILRPKFVKTGIRKMWFK